MVMLALASMTLYLGWSVRPAATELSYGYASYYTAARLLRDGFEPDRFYENRWFLNRSIEQGFMDTPDIYNINPPPTSMVLLPLSSLSPEDADIIWTLANVIILAAAMMAIFDTLRSAGLAIDCECPSTWALSAWCGVYNPIWENIASGRSTSSCCCS